VTKSNDEFLAEIARGPAQQLIFAKLVIRNEEHL